MEKIKKLFIVKKCKKIDKISLFVVILTLFLVIFGCVMVLAQVITPPKSAMATNISFLLSKFAVLYWEFLR